MKSSWGFACGGCHRTSTRSRGDPRGPSCAGVPAGASIMGEWNTDMARRNVVTVVVPERLVLFARYRATDCREAISAVRWQGMEQLDTGSKVVRPLWFGEVEREIEWLSRPESVGLVAGNRAAGLSVLEELGRLFGAEPVSITEVGTMSTPARSSQELMEGLAGCSLLFDLEALCWSPWLGVDVLRFLRLHARKGGVVALWPGRIRERVATFSVQGRNDYVRVDVGGVSVLRPVPTCFPDEVPFEIERIPR